MSNLFRNLQPKAHLHKNGFDLSQRHIFTQSAGELLPTLCIDCVPNDIFEINLMNMVRTLPMNSAAYTRIKWFHHFFFVPYSVLWQQWDSFITQRTNNYSANVNGSKYVPSVNLKEVINVIDEGTAAYKDLFGYDAKDRAPKLWDSLGYGNFYFGEHSSTVNDVTVNLFRLAAYNKIWYDYYRNPYYDDVENLSRLDYVYEWNFDDLLCRDAASALLDVQSASGIRNNSSYLTHMFCPKYRQYKKDLLTSLMPDTQFGAVSYVNVGDSSNDFSLYTNAAIGDSNKISGFAGGNNSGTAAIGELGINRGTASFGTSPIDSVRLYSPDLGFDVLSLRKAEMLQRWKETTLRAGQQALKQYDAHFGVRPRHTVDHTAEFLGGVDQMISVDEIVQQSNDISNGTSTDKGTGDIYGKGISVSNHGHIKFNASEFGVLMCISSFVPEADYLANGIDKGNINFEPFDFFTPEFQDIGMEGVPFSTFNGDRDYQDANTIVGYAPRYWQYKTAIDKLHGGFLEGSDSASGFGNWVTPRLDYQNFDQGLTRKSLYIDPKILNPIFAIAFDGKVTNDQFMCNNYFDIKAIRPMSVLGLPIW